MKKCLFILMVVSVLAALAQAAELEKMSVDFGAAGTPVQSGYVAYTAADKNLASFTTQSYTVFETSVSVLVQWTVPVTAATARVVDRGLENYEDATEDLMRDWIATDIRPGNTGDPMTLTITGLPAGQYIFVSYHTDTEPTVNIGTADVTVNDATGSATTMDIHCTNNSAVTFDSITKFEATITSDGLNPVTIVYDMHPFVNQWNECFFVINGFDLTLQFIRGGATDPVPLSGFSTVDSQATTAVSWTAPVDPNLVSISGYDVYFGTDPNVILNPKTFVTSASKAVTPAFDTTYYWRVDTHVVWDSDGVTGSINDTVEGFVWFFTTLPDDITPVVTCGSDVLTAMELLPATLAGAVNDSGEGDIAGIAWEVIGTDAPNTAMQMITRNSAAALANMAQITTDPNLLMDWIGTDTREVGDPMVLTLKGLPNGTYSWTSYHHDPDVTNVGMFDVTVIDASGSTVTADIQIGDSNSLPIGTFTTAITANGTDDVILVFDQHPYAGLGYNDAWFVMNGFELTSGSGSLNIDFGNVGTAAMPGYQAYEATHEVKASFTEQSYSAFGTTVSILPTWGGYAVVTDTTTNLLSPTATLTADWPGEYTVQLSATDNASQTGTDTMVVTVTADACAAAQQSTSWAGFSDYDLNTDCVVNLGDLAIFAVEWLNDRNLAGQE
jgi:hypothetical protein